MLTNEANFTLVDVLRALRAFVAGGTGTDEASRNG